MACVHLMDEKRPPWTLCGVDTSFKTGAKWTENNDDVTCKNCIKLRDGGQMGAPPPQSGGKAEKVQKIKEEVAETGFISPQHAKLFPYWQRLDQIGRLLTKMDSTVMDAKNLLDNVVTEDEMPNLMQFLEYMDAAKDWLDMVASPVRHRMLEEANGMEGSISLR